ncbi:MAG: porphobilinogen synthase [Candidatus Omnitrophota bacterium]|nr:porphobilinogen synthase [Candidatus Omnitrophota bacterium]
MTQLPGQYPEYRPRRMRQNEAFRRLIRETRLSAEQLIMPYFVVEGRGVKEAIEAMPGQYRYSPDTLLAELETLVALDVRTVLLFGVPDENEKDEQASAASSAEGILQKTVREIKSRFKDLLVITDVCLCAYTSHGHCGMLSPEGQIDNDASLDRLAETALSHAQAGADIVAPSDMMDGRIRAIRTRLDAAGFKNTAILSYAAKYASAFYGPFREAAHSAPAAGDRCSYQMDPANREEALREIAMDIQEGADMVMVKPALAYLDVLREARERFQFPLAAYAVSGEYSMLKAASERGWVDEKKIVLEMAVSLLRSGANTIVTYHAKDIAFWLKNSQVNHFKEVKTF